MRLIVAMFGAVSCATARLPIIGGYTRPAEIAGEWVDVSKSAATDTSVWVLRSDGYDGTAHIRLTTDSTGATRVSRADTRYGEWYVDGTLGDSAHQALCVSRRVGRFGAFCYPFFMDTVRGPGGAVPRLMLHGYRGEHHTSDRLLIARQRKSMGERQP